MVLRTPEILKIKIGAISLYFEKMEKITLNTLNKNISELKKTISEFNDKFKYQS
jgi:hypothetical protein